MSNPSTLVIVYHDETHLPTTSLQFVIVSSTLSESTLYVFVCMSITAPQDAHKRLVAEWLTAPLYYTRPEVEGFRDQGFVLQIWLK